MDAWFVTLAAAGLGASLAASVRRIYAQPLYWVPINMGVACLAVIFWLN